MTENYEILTKISKATDTLQDDLTELLEHFEKIADTLDQTHLVRARNVLKFEEPVREHFESLIMSPLFKDISDLTLDVSNEVNYLMKEKQ